MVFHIPKEMINFEVFRKVILSSINYLFLKNDEIFKNNLYKKDYFYKMIRE